jgi:DNA-binding MarR family transcriptional regulator
MNIYDKLADNKIPPHHLRIMGFLHRYPMSTLSEICAGIKNKPQQVNKALLALLEKEVIVRDRENERYVYLLNYSYSLR